MGLLQMSFTGAILIVVVAAIRAITVNKLPKQTFLILWGVVLFRLLLPVSVPSAFSVYSFLQTILPQKQFMFVEAEKQVEFLNPDISQEKTNEATKEKLSLQNNTTPDTQTASVFFKVAKTGNIILTNTIENQATKTGKILLTNTIIDNMPISILNRNALQNAQYNTTINGQNNSILDNICKSVIEDKNKIKFWDFFSNILFGQRNAKLIDAQLNILTHINICTIISIIWLIGIIVSSTFFIHSYLRCRFEFQTAMPLNVDFAEQWLKAHPLKRSISIKQLDRIDAPLTYGIFHPVILMPKNTEWLDVKHLQYIFMHEYIHICRFDMLKKLFCIMALCVHWFNPMVWLMYFLFNRDIELSCDERVVHWYGEPSKTIYARMLIGMEAKKSGLTPFCNHFSKNAIEERITAIMKTKKKTFGVVLLAIILVISITTAFATSATEAKLTDEITEAPFRNFFSDKEYQKLCALQLEGYEDMTIARFQEKEWALTDTKEYLDLRERLDIEESLYEKKDTDELASFIYYIFEPLTATQWKTRTYDGAAWSIVPPSIADFSAMENGLLEYTITMTILNSDTLTVKEYNNTRLEIINGLQSIFTEKTVEELADENAMCEEIESVIHTLIEQYSTEKLQVAVEYVYQAVSNEFSAFYKEYTEQMEELLAVYAPFGLTYYYDMETGYYKMYFQGKEVRGIYDEVKQVWISEHAGIGENINRADAIELFAVYKNGRLSGLTEGTAAQQEEWAKMRQQTTDSYWDAEMEKQKQTSSEQNEKEQQVKELEEMEKVIQTEEDYWKDWVDNELKPYTAVGLTYQCDTDEMKVTMYYQGKEVKGIIDEQKHIWITGNTAAHPTFSGNVIELCAVYQDEDLAALREGTIKERKEWKKLYSAAAEQHGAGDIFNIVEIREFAPATQEDYQALLKLKTSNYQNMSIADFSTALFDWGMKYSDSYDRITCDRIWKDYQVPLSDKEKTFVEQTLLLTTIENREIVRSQYTGKAEEDPAVGEIWLEKTAQGKQEGIAWCNLSYQFTYHISDKKIVTVGERDRCIGGIMDEIQEYWDKTSIDELVRMEKKDVVKLLKDLAAKYSNEHIRITIIEEHIGYECMDERDWNLYS